MTLFGKIWRPIQYGILIVLITTVSVSAAVMSPCIVGLKPGHYKGDPGKRTCLDVTNAMNTDGPSNCHKAAQKEVEHSSENNWELFYTNSNSQLGGLSCEEWVADCPACKVGEKGSDKK